ncbi:MAG: PilZ domain-containing protein [Desulfobulbus sp.]|jgi:hypothetical protein
MGKTTTPRQNETTQHKTPRLAVGLCPYWAASTRTCQLITDGLFLPISQHVAAYCTSNNHASCTQYQKCTEHPSSPQKSELLQINRRRSLRIPTCYNFRFSELSSASHRHPVSNEAWTIDLSDHGIRFASRLRLQPDTLILFALKTDDMVETFEGTGRVVWSEPFENTKLFSIGMTFAPNPAAPVD